MTPELAEAIRASAARLGANPVDLGTLISYETGGTFDPWKAGPTTQWGQHRGLIQWGEPQRQRYGVYQGMPVEAQMQAAEKYLTDAGYRPGMGILDMYSAINAGRVGRYNATDANNGGAPGTVADKVNNQMAGHRAKAERFLGATGEPSQVAAVTAQSPQVVPSGLMGAFSEPSAEAREASESAIRTQMAGLLAHATGQGEQSQPVGLLNDDFGPSQFPKIQIGKMKRRA